MFNQSSLKGLKRASLPIIFALSAPLMLAGCGEEPDAQAQSTEIASQALAFSKALTVYKSPTCGCCEDWIKHADENGFELTAEHPQDLAGLKADLGIGPQYRSCHTAVTKEGFVFEGHVPAKLVEQFLASPPKDAIGLAVPGMPAGSPGMEMGDRFTPYQVLTLMKDGTHQLYAMVDSQSEQY